MRQLAAKRAERFGLTLGRVTLQVDHVQRRMSVALDMESLGAVDPALAKVGADASARQRRGNTAHEVCTRISPIADGKGPDPVKGLERSALDSARAEWLRKRGVNKNLPP